MPDITLCANATCPMKSSCYRRRAKPNTRQSYAYFKPEADGTCCHYKPIYVEEASSPQSQSGNSPQGVGDQEL